MAEVVQREDGGWMILCSDKEFRLLTVACGNNNEEKLFSHDTKHFLKYCEQHPHGRDNFQLYLALSAPLNKENGTDKH